MTVLQTLVALLLILVSTLASATTFDAKNLDKIKLPPGFKISILVKDIKGARSMALSDEGTLYVGTRDEGKVYAVTFPKGQDPKITTLVSGLNSPNGVALREGALFVAEINRIIKFKDIEKNLKSDAHYEVIFDKLPSDAHHGWKFIRFSPDGWLYVPVGAPCNICLKDDERYASLSRMHPDGSGFEIYAHGIRNTVGFDWDPSHHELWFTDNGRDMLGDDLPPDELNHAPKKGMNFGFPYCFGQDGVNPEFKDKHKDCHKFTPPTVDLEAHVAALGMRFYTGSQFPAEYKNKIFIAEHGSWNRTIPNGYRVITVSKNKAGKYEASRFAEGWLQDQKDVLGRPVDIQQMPDGSILVSDDYTGTIYQITYAGATAGK